MAEKKKPRFTKQQIVKSARYKDQPDLVNALLQADQEYTLDQVDKIITEYLNKEVK